MAAALQYLKEHQLFEYDDELTEYSVGLFEHNKEVEWL